MVAGEVFPRTKPTVRRRLPRPARKRKSSQAAMSPSEINDPIVHSEALVPGQRISLDTAHAERLRFREINPKEAFTLVDKDGRFFRASLIELSKNGGEALVYEVMPLSPESPARITLFCAVLARQRML